MPKVGKFHWSYKQFSVSLEVDVWFGSYGKRRIDQKDKYFWIKLPEEVAEFNEGNAHVTGTTNEAVIQEFKTVMTNFYDQKQSKRKVIGYKFESEIGEQDTYDKGLFRPHEMKLEFVIGTITTIGTKEFFSENKSSQLHALGKERWSNYRDYTFINHSPEAEEWFVKTWKGFKEIIKGCRKFFGQSEDKLLQSIQSSNLLLPAPETKKK